MSDRPEAGSGPLALSDWEVERLAEHLDGLLVRLLEDGDQELAAAVVGLLEGIERLHAEGLRRVAELLARNRDLFSRAARDPVISGLFDLYDLSVSGMADAGGAAAELDPGGISPTGDVSIVPSTKLVQLRHRLGRSKGTRISDGVATFDLDELGDEDLCGLSVGSTSVLVVRDGRGGVRAYRNACPGSPLPLHLGRLEEGALVCPWHGCRFDAASGARLEGEGPGLGALEATVEGRRLTIDIA